MPKNKIAVIKTDKLDYIAQNKWILELLLLNGQPDYELSGFFQHFQALFGGMSKNKGILTSQREIAEHMGKSVRYVKYKLAELVELGILSYARKSTHPRAGGVYFINIEKPHQFDARAESYKLTDSRVQPVEKQAEEVLDSVLDLNDEYMKVAVEAGEQFINVQDGAKVRDFVYRDLLDETISIAQVINAVVKLKETYARIDEDNWQWATGLKLSLTEEQRRAALITQKKLAGDL